MAFAAGQSTGFGTRGVLTAGRLSWAMRLLILAGLAFLAVYAGASEQQEAAEGAIAEMEAAPAADEAVAPETEAQEGSVVASEEAPKQPLLSTRNKFIAAGALATSLLLCLLFLYLKAAHKGRSQQEVATELLKALKSFGDLTYVDEQMEDIVEAMGDFLRTKFHDVFHERKIVQGKRFRLADRELKSQDFKRVLSLLRATEAEIQELDDDAPGSETQSVVIDPEDYQQQEQQEEQEQQQEDDGIEGDQNDQNDQN